MSQQPDICPDDLSPAERADKACRELSAQIDQARRVLNDYRALLADQASNDDRRLG
jgi:hypothetical protein